MKEKKVTIQVPEGLEVRPVAVLVQIASQFESSVYLETEDKRVNAKSIMGMMTLGLNSGEEVLVTADGPDEEAAVKEVEACLLWSDRTKEGE